MHFSHTVALATLAAFAQAISFPSFSFGSSSSLFTRGNGGQCPPVWSQISNELTTLFLTDGQCNDDARAAIRGAFHDCFPDGGCDGSLAIPEELARPENAPMSSTINKFVGIAQQFNVTNADMIAFAAAHAIVTCPLGPRVPIFIGRKDATAPCPPGQLPKADVSADDALSHFQARGFTAQDLAALIGAHTASRQFVTDTTNVGASQDTTPGIWDIIYFVQTLLGTAPVTFQSDINISKHSATGPFFQQFSKDKASWDAAFTSAMQKMQSLGSTSGMVDCTGALPQSHQRRDAKAAPIMARAM